MSSILEVKNLSIQIQNRTVLQNISFRINPGEAVLLSGANGIGKSTLLKSIMRLDESGKIIHGSINYSGFGEVLMLNGEELQQYRSTVAYVGQRDDYSEMGNVRVADIIGDSYKAFSGRMLSLREVNSLIDEWLPRKSDNSRSFEAISKPGKFSGGEQRLLSVLSTIATRSESKLLIIDEPLNNLDFANARIISNLINRVLRQNPAMGLLMISHCRIFPFISREIQLTTNGIVEVADPYTCHSCFGVPNENGFY